MNNESKTKIEVMKTKIEVMDKKIAELQENQVQGKGNLDTIQEMEREVKGAEPNQEQQAQIASMKKTVDK